MTESSTDNAATQNHVLRLRVVGAAFFVLQPVTFVVLLLASMRMENALLSPTQVTLVLAAAGLWLAFTADRDAKRRLAHAKHGFTVHGEEHQLLREHLLIYVLVLARLEAIAICGVLAAFWGLGPSISIWFLLLAMLLMGLAWPTPRKTQLLIERAHAARKEVAG